MTNVEADDDDDDDDDDSKNNYDGDRHPRTQKNWKSRE